MALTSGCMIFRFARWNRHIGRWPKEHHRLESPLSRRMRAMRRESCMRRDIPFDGTAWIVPGMPDQIQGEMRAMRCSFRFAPFGNNVLMTNDAGKYVLTPEEFRLFVSDQMDQNSETWKMLCERHFATEERAKPTCSRRVRRSWAIMPIYSGERAFSFWR